MLFLMCWCWWEVRNNIISFSRYIFSNIYIYFTFFNISFSNISFWQDLAKTLQNVVDIGERCRIKVDPPTYSLINARTTENIFARFFKVKDSLMNACTTKNIFFFFNISLCKIYLFLYLICAKNFISRSLWNISSSFQNYCTAGTHKGQ